MRAVVRAGFLMVCGAMIVIILSPLRSNAVSQHVVIRSVIAADTIDTNDELIELENRSAAPVDVTNWSVMYIASTNSTSSLVTIRPTDANVRILLPAGARESFVSTKYAVNHPVTDNYRGAVQFAGKISYTMAGLELRDESGDMVDSVRWGNWSTVIDASPAASLSSTTLLQRSGSDTDSNRNDFKLLPQADQVFGYGHLNEVVDRCSNIDGIQETMPADFMEDTKGGCVSVDQCPNIVGIQREMPSGMELYGMDCLPVFQPAALFVTELLANPGGVDTGNEYIEFYNSTHEAVSLADYYLIVGTKRVVFPEGATIAARSYQAFSDSELGITLPNTTGVAVKLMSRNNLIVDYVPPYVNAAIDTAWGWVNDAWQYTNQPTPGAANLASLIEDGTLPTPDSGVVACADGYYRNPLTNRCNKIKADEVPTACKANQYRSDETGRCRNYATITTPVACKEGQYRSEETGRCRSIAQTAAAALKPCADDQFRNPTTGRCKKIASTDDLLKPCASGYERNLETNRCRKVTTGSMPLAAFPVEAIAPSGATVGVWVAAGAVVTGGLGYAAWEWRRELAAALSRVARVGRK